MMGLRLTLQWLADPAAVIGAGLLIVTAMLIVTRAHRVALALCAATTLVHFWLGSPVIANAALGWLERQAKRQTSCAEPPRGAWIVVLAGGISSDPRPDAIDHPEYLRDASWHRALAGIRLAQADPTSTLLFSGGYGRDVREADLMASLARQAGLPSERIELERESKSTRQSAQRVAEMLAPRPARPVMLVTSAAHMPRAAAMFRAAHVAACTHPVDFRRAWPEWYDAFVPRLSAVEKSADAYREIASLLVLTTFGDAQGL